MLFGGGFGVTKIQNGYDLSEMMPQNSPAKEFWHARYKYFSYYNMHVVTQEEVNGVRFDYAKPENQKLLYDLHANFSKVS